MSTITKEFTKEQLIEKLQHRISVASGFPESEKAQMDLELARIALASLEAEPAIHRWRRVTSEPYGPYPWHYGDFIGFSKPVDGIEDEYFYAAPPAPANAEPVAWLWSHRKHPSEVSLVRPEDDERAEGAHWSGWSCQALYAAPPAPVSVPEWTNEQCLEFLSIAFRHAEIKGDLELDDIRLGVKMVNGSRSAMLQGAEPVTTDYKFPDPIKDNQLNSGLCADDWYSGYQAGWNELLEAVNGNSPVIQDGWVACSERLPENKPGSYEYLVFESLNNVVHHDYWNVPDAGDDCQFTPFWNHYDRYVTHWMPLPAAPQQEVK